MTWKNEQTTKQANDGGNGGNGGGAKETLHKHMTKQNKPSA